MEESNLPPNTDKIPSPETENQKSWKRFMNFMKSEDGKLTTDLVFKALKTFAPNAFVAFWDFMIVCVFLGTVIACAANKWIESRTTETLLVLIIGTIIGAKFKEK